MNYKNTTCEIWCSNCNHNWIMPRQLLKQRRKFIFFGKIIFGSECAFCGTFNEYKEINQGRHLREMLSIIKEIK